MPPARFRLRMARPGLIVLLGLSGLLALAAPARADDDGRARRTTPPLPLYAQECGACHLAYPAGLLPATSWQRLMADLPHHFGTDASLDAATRQTLAAWLQANAGSTGKARRDPAPPPDNRITRAPWFVREHREVAAASWTLPAVKSASNCAACHTHADQGVFSEHDVRIPR